MMRSFKVNVFTGVCGVFCALENAWQTANISSASKNMDPETDEKWRPRAGIGILGGTRQIWKHLRRCAPKLLRLPRARCFHICSDSDHGRAHLDVNSI